MGTLALDPLGVAGIGAADDLVDEGSVGGQIGEVGRRPQQQGIGYGPLEVAVRALDRAVLVGYAGRVAGRRHAVVGTQRLVAKGDVRLRRLVEVAEGRRQAVGAVLARRPASSHKAFCNPSARATKLSPPRITCACSKPEYDRSRGGRAREPSFLTRKGILTAGRPRSPPGP